MRRTNTGGRPAAAALALLLAAASGGAYALEQQAEVAESAADAPSEPDAAVQALKEQVELLQKQLQAVQEQLQALQGQAAPSLQALREQVELLQKQLEEVRQQLQGLQAQQDEARQDAERERLKQAAAAAAAEAARGEGAGGEEGETGFVSGTRMQPQLNPEISVNGDLFAIAGNNEKNRFSVGEWEVDFQAYLDPFSRMHLVLAKPEEEGLEIEEGYLSWMNLPGSTSLTFGRKRQQFGVLNRWHPHALDQADVPLVLQESFGDEGLKGTGLSFDWLMPHLWADANELTVEIMDGDNDVAFAGDSWEHLSYLARLKSYWDLTPDSYLEIGLNGLQGKADSDGNLDHGFLALDFTYNWYPAGRSLYRDFTLRGMVLRSDLEREGMTDRRAWGGYAYGQFKFTPQWIAGLRFDRVDDQRLEAHHFWGVSPYVTFWQSEYVRLRLQGSYIDDNMLGLDRRAVFQVTLAAGPHKHESY